jgi:hypothetical protein
MPGPYFGYWNRSISVVISVEPFWGRNAAITAFMIVRFLMRCAAQSAWISVAGMPHTFSV